MCTTNPLVFIIFPDCKFIYDTISSPCKVYHSWYSSVLKKETKSSAFPGKFSFKLEYSSSDHICYSRELNQLAIVNLGYLSFNFDIHTKSGFVWKQQYVRRILILSIVIKIYFFDIQTPCCVPQLKKNPLFQCFADASEARTSLYIFSFSFCASLCVTGQINACSWAVSMPL